MPDCYITNPNYNDWIDSQREFAACEQTRREASWASAALLSTLGLAQIIAYADEYEDVVDWREAINRRLYNCLKAEHDFWMAETYPKTIDQYDDVIALAEITPDYADPFGDHPQVDTSRGTLTEWNFRETGDCDNCDRNFRQGANMAALADAMSFRVRHQERRAERRREVKSDGMAAADAAGKNYAAPGRRALGLSLDMANTLVAMAASGLNAGTQTLGTGLGSWANASSGTGGNS